MYCYKSAHKRINSIHRRALRAAHLDFSTNSGILLDHYNSTPIHSRNLRLSVIEVYKSIHRLSPEFMWNIFQSHKTKFNLRSGNTLKFPVGAGSKGQNSKTSISASNGMESSAGLR